MTLESIEKLPFPESADKDWLEWVHSLQRPSKEPSIRDVVCQILFDGIVYGGEMGPNGNTYAGVDEGLVLTMETIDLYVEQLQNLTGHGTCHGKLSVDEFVFCPTYGARVKGGAE